MKFVHVIGVFWYCEVCSGFVCLLTFHPMLMTLEHLPLWVLKQCSEEINWRESICPFKLWCVQHVTVVLILWFEPQHLSFFLLISHARSAHLFICMLHFWDGGMRNVGIKGQHILPFPVFQTCAVSWEKVEHVLGKWLNF